MTSWNHLSTLLIVAFCIAGAFGGSIRNRKSVENFIQKVTYADKTGKPVLNEKVTVTEHEAKFEVGEGMNGVIDYEQKLFIFTSGKYCHVLADFDTSVLPSIQDIKTMIEENTKFEKPSKIKKIHYKASGHQKIPPLMTLAKELCKDKQVIRVEETTEDDMRRMKREVGAGEVVVIIVAIVLLGFLG